MKLAWIISLAAGGVGAVAAVAAAVLSAALSSGVTLPPPATMVLYALFAALMTAAAAFAAAWVIQKHLASLRLTVGASEPSEAPAGRLIGPLDAIARLHLEVVERLASECRSIRSQFRQMEIRRHLAETEVQHLSDVLHSLRDAVLVTNEFNEVVMANDAAASLFKFSRDEAISKPVSKVVRESEIVGLINEAAEGGGTSGRRLAECVLPREPEPLNVEVSLSALCDPTREAAPGGDRAGRGAGVVTILHDITQERQVSRMKNEFVSKASHELRTPLSSIKAYIEMLLDGEARDDKSRREFYEIMQHEAERLGRMIDNMLNISRIEAGMIKANWENVDLVVIAQEAADLLMPQAAEKKIRINLQRPHQACHAEVDRDMIKQVITNLISNAIKYTPEGGRVTVAPDLTDCDRSVMVSVSDTGLGIPADAMPKLFNKFYRVDKHERVAKGTGLGLNLVKQIVEAVHHGEVGVESEAGKGSRFWFIVPCRQGGS